jgi:hypothetical protein
VHEQQVAASEEWMQRSTWRGPVMIHHDMVPDWKLKIESYALLGHTQRPRITAKIPATLLGAHRLQPSSPTINWAANWSPKALQHRS